MARLYQLFYYAVNLSYMNYQTKNLLMSIRNFTPEKVYLPNHNMKFYYRILLNSRSRMVSAYLEEILSSQSFISENSYQLIKILLQVKSLSLEACNYWRLGKRMQQGWSEGEIHPRLLHFCVCFLNKTEQTRTEN